MAAPERYDVIVVGAGAAGCALAARLSEDPARSVLLIEAGPRFIGVEAYPPELRYSSMFSACAPGHPNNWGFFGTLRPGVHAPSLRGRVVGGSTAINGAAFTRGLAEDFDSWGAEAWSYEAVLPFFLKLERDGDFADPNHNEKGPAPINRVRREDWSPASTAFYQACLEAGFPHDADMNAPGSIGVGALPMNNVDGVRFNMAMAYLDPVEGRPNLTVLSDATVLKVIVDQGRATGVLVQQNGETFEISAGEVALSAGAIKSPHLLMLSGIGPADELRAAGLPVLHDLPHVGKNFTDHCTMTVPVQVRGLPRRAAHKHTLSEVSLHYTTPGSADHSDMMLMPTLIPRNAAVLEGANLFQQALILMRAARQMSWSDLKGQLLNDWDIGISVILMLGQSRGEVGLSSADPLAAPALNYNYLEDAEDRRRLREGLRLTDRLLKSEPYRKIKARGMGPSDETLASDARLDEYLRANVRTTYHMASTCRMGAGPADSVVDQYCRVHGVPNLRVVDTSIMPICVRRCPAASTVMIGERAAAFF
jgi:choline dehydrogenase-like flavoprotein